MGNSISQGLFDNMPGFFMSGRIGQGIGGQTTTQMLLRFRQDVIDLKPRLVQIMAGTKGRSAERLDAGPCQAHRSDLCRLLVGAAGRTSDPRQLHL